MTSLFVKTVETIISNYSIETDVGAYMKKDVNGGNGFLLVYGFEGINNRHIIFDIDVTLGIALLSYNYIELYVGSHIKKAFDTCNWNVL